MDQLHLISLKSYLVILVFFFAKLMGVSSTVSTISLSETDSTTESQTMEIEKMQRGEIQAVPMTEQVMNPDIKISDIPDVDVTANPLDSAWNMKRAIRDVAYFLRVHKFQDFDRRYYRSEIEVPARLYEEFPRPPLRSVHWEVRKHCDDSFLECLRYLERIVKQTYIRRENDTTVIVNERKWSLQHNREQINEAQKQCLEAQKLDNLTMAPFQGPIERFQWRTSASYYMCWYTMLGIPGLRRFGESCDNHANCLLEYGPRNGDPRADDTKPYACALYSFCPDHCCPMRHIRDLKDCFRSQLNPCYADNPAGHRECLLKREENQDLESLRANRINVSCECQKRGYEWSSQFGQCVDVNECIRGLHNCSMNQRESCLNLPGGFECVCLIGYAYNMSLRGCVEEPFVKAALAWRETVENITETKSVLDKIVEVITRSPATRFTCSNLSLALIGLVYLCR